MKSPHPKTRKLIRRFKLKKHPEGGFFSETYRSDEYVTKAALAPRFAGPRAYSTAIYYLLERGDFSALHRIKSDEIWHYYAGAPLQIVTLSPRGLFSKVYLGMNLEKGERPQICIPRGVWFGAALREEGRDPYSLVGCTVAPGFDFSDFEMARRETLINKFPKTKREILKWTREFPEAKVNS